MATLIDEYIPGMCICEQVLSFAIGLRLPSIEPAFSIVETYSALPDRVSLFTNLTADWSIFSPTM